MQYASEDINQSNFLMILESQPRSLGKLVAYTNFQQMTMSMLCLIKFSTPEKSFSIHVYFVWRQFVKIRIPPRKKRLPTNSYPKCIGSRQMVQKRLTKESKSPGGPRVQSKFCPIQNLCDKYETGCVVDNQGDVSQRAITLCYNIVRLFATYYHQ